MLGEGLGPRLHLLYDHNGIKMTWVCDLGPEGQDSFLPLWETQQKNHPLLTLQETDERCGRPMEEAELEPKPQPPVLPDLGAGGRAGLRRRPRGAPRYPPACPSWPGHQGTQVVLGTRLLLRGPSSKISSTHGESRHHGNVEVALRPRNQLQLLLSPAWSPGGACYGQVPGQALLHSHPTEVNPVFLTLQMRALGLGWRPGQSHTARMLGLGYSRGWRWEARTHTHLPAWSSLPADSGP